MTVVGVVALCWDLAVVSLAHFTSAHQLNCQKVGTVIPCVKPQLSADLALLEQPDEVSARKQHLTVCKDLSTHVEAQHVSWTVAF